MIRFDRFHGGKRRMLTMSYDDGRTQDRRLVDIFNRYGIRGAFHVNSGKFGAEGYVTAAEVATLYKGHEVSVHTVHHPRLTEIQPFQAISEVLDDKRNLEALCGYPVRGMSFPFGVTSDAVEALLEPCGMRYARTVVSTNGYKIPDNFLRWDPTCHHKDALGRAEAFAACDNPWRMQLFYIWGHSYEFDNDNNWELIETLCRTVSGLEDVWYATNIEIYDYITALKRLILSADEKIIVNPSARPVWVSADGETVEIPGGGRVDL